MTCFKSLVLMNSS